ncbi:MAG TPA: outer membrane beta-barrel protein [Kiritimatiellia bacterium]|nr:outer membrane beta-barrel protein [Kiritimatiellia bacterium]HRZ12507.1 outer membrane beta-barrel protein [Kiritimatiellia bacterium]HSA17735.1 outer membrane beta-barrel protein [Kiritimatiellia bacterium]
MKKMAAMLVGMMCLGGVAHGESRLGPFASWLTSNDENAFGVGLKYEWLFNGKFGMDARAGYLTDSDMYVIPLELGVVGILPLERLSLYAGVGGGYYIPEDIGMSTPWGPVDGPDATFGFYGVAGIRMPTGKNMEFFAEAKYTRAESDEESTSGPIYRNGQLVGYTVHQTTKMGMDLDGIGANAGILWKF